MLLRSLRQVIALYTDLKILLRNSLALLAPSNLKLQRLSYSNAPRDTQAKLAQKPFGSKRLPPSRRLNVMLLKHLNHKLSHKKLKKWRVWVLPPQP
jgi:hypothetical protein